jgi:DNA polymerase-3 subunit delta'
LKILEEPPSYGVFILLTDSPEKLLPTVRSRATELRLQGLPREVLRTQLQKDFPQADEESLEAAMDRSGGYLGQAKAILEQGDSASEQTENFLNAFAHKDAVLLTTTLVAMERLNRDKLLPELTVWAEHLQQALVCRSGSKVALKGARDLAAARSSAELLSALRCVQKSMDYLQGNVSGAAICGYLAWALR